MMSSLRVVALAIALTAAATQPTFAITKPLAIGVRVTNESRTCAWVTAYYSRVYLPWTKFAYGFVHPNQYHVFTTSNAQIEGIKFPVEIKVRAEFKKNADCSGGTVADYHVQRKNFYPEEAGGLVLRVANRLTGPPWSVKELEVYKP